MNTTSTIDRIDQKIKRGSLIVQKDTSIAKAGLVILVTSNPIGSSVKGVVVHVINESTSAMGIGEAGSFNMDGFELYYGSVTLTTK